MPTIPKTHSGKRFKKNPNDYYETPLEIAIACLKTIPYNTPETLLDVGCGSGVWGKASNHIFDYPMSFGIDTIKSLSIDSESITPEPYDFYDVADYLTFDYRIYHPLGQKRTFDLIIGNPPYSSETNLHLVEDIILHSLDLLSENGYLGFLLKTEFTASARRYKNIFSFHAPLFEYQLVQRPYWTNYKKGSNTIEYSFFIWGKNKNIETRKRWLSWK